MVQLTNKNAVIKNNLWVSAHLYYEEPWDNFIRQAIIPIIDDILKNQLATNCFFIRYFEKGAHIRLRFKVDSLKKHKILQRVMKKYFRNYFLKHPSVRDEKKYSKDIRKTLIKNNSIKFIKYRPEIKRYRGSYGVFIAEKLFEASSAAVLLNIKNTNWNYERALGAAIDMHIILLFALKIGKKESIDLLNYYISSSLYGIRKLNKSQYNNLIKKYEKNFNSQKQFLIPYAQRLITAIKNNSLKGNIWMNNWQKSVAEINGQIEKAKSEKLLKYLNHSENDDKNLWPIIGSFIHMTNNRLGIKTEEEPFITYLIKETLLSILD